MSAAVLQRLTTIARQAAPGQIALRDGTRALSHTELLFKVAVAANWLRSTAGDVIALQLPNSADWVLLDLACQMAEIICLPLPEFFTAEQTRHCLAAAAADLLITAHADRGAEPIPLLPGLYARRLHPEKKPGTHWPEGTRKITFTSGSTGTPRGVCLDADLQWRVAQALAAAIAIHGVRHLCLLPLPTLLENIAGVYAPLLSGGEVILPSAQARGLSGSSGLNLPAMLQCIAQEQPQTLILLPQLLRALVTACRQGWQPPASLRFVAVGGARVAPELIAQARAAGLPVYEGYGLSECGSVVALNTPAHDSPGSVGQVLPHCRVDIENGEIIVSGASHLGYLGQPTSWRNTRIATGDLGHLDARGQLYVSGRRKNLLITGFGRNISPEWVESELCAGSLLTHCVVIGDARPHLAAIVGAAAAVSDAAIQHWLDAVNAKLPDYARVRAWLRLDATAWPPLLTANGRPRRDRINARLASAIHALYANAGNHPPAAGRLV